MRAFAITAALFAVASLANPMNVVRHESADACEDTPPCMTYDQASQVANNFRELIVRYSNETAKASLTESFVDYSDSVNELINEGCPSGLATLSAPTFSGRLEFMAGQGSQPSIPFETLNLWHTCDTVMIRWRSAQKPQLVTGIIVLEAEYSGRQDEPFLISTAYSEFNSGAWMANLGMISCDS